MNREYDIATLGAETLPAFEKPAVIHTTEGFRDVLHMSAALHAYKEAKSLMAQGHWHKGVVLFNKDSKLTFRVDTPQDLKILLYAASHAYNGARREGLGDVATIVKEEIRTGGYLRDMSPNVAVDVQTPANALEYP
jgi:hypothetical protein